MSRSPPDTPPLKAAPAGLGLRWFQSLQFKLGLLFLALLALIGGAAFYAADRLIGAGLEGNTFRYETAVSDRLAARIALLTRGAEDLAGALAALAREARGGGRVVLRAPAQALVERAPESRLILAVGIWPEPGTMETGVERASLYWLRDARGQLQAHEDYNAPRVIPYFREAWYTPARYAAPERCYWTPAYADALSQRLVVTCSLPYAGARSFAGVATVSLDLEALSALFAESTKDDSGYAVLLDRDDRLLALSALAQGAFGGTLGRGRNIAELAQRQPSFNPLVLALHRRGEEFRSSAISGAGYDARLVSALKDGTRDYSRTEADSALAAIWNDAARRPPAPAEDLRLPQDAALGEDGYALLSELPGTHWRLASVTPLREGQEGLRYFTTQALVVTLGACALALALAWGVVRGTLLRPLRRMARQLAGSERAELALQVALDESARNEVGLLAHWHNQRAQQLRELIDRAHVAQSQLAAESGERGRIQEALARAQERANLAFSAVGDSVIAIDERGQVEELNPAAERLLGARSREARGRPLGEVLKLRLGGQRGAALPNLGEIVAQRGARLDYPGGVFIDTAGGEREIQLSVAAMRAPTGRALGCIVVFREVRGAQLGAATAGALPVAVEAPDPITGLGGRAACERRLRALAGAGGALVALDLDQFSRVNELGGHDAGDRLLARVAELVGARAGGADRLFRLPGDRFALIVEQADEKLTLAAAEGLRAALAQARFSAGPHEVKLTGSFGVCLLHGLGANPGEALRRAGEALLAAKRAGRNQVVLYRPELETAVVSVDDALWVQRIRRGLDENCFHLTTQSILPLQSTRTFAGEGQVFEMLLALEDEEGFWNPPENFLSVAQRHGLASELDRWTIRRTLETLDAQDAVRERLAFCIVALSPSSLADRGLLDFVAETFNRHPPATVQKLCFEVPEEAVSKHPQEAQQFCETMRSIGCRLALGQYLGRRASDLALLRRLPLELIRLDAQSLRNLAGDAAEQIVAESTLRLAHHLRKRVIVSGLDSEALLAAWRRAGADYLQGNAVAKVSPVVFQPVG